VASSALFLPLVAKGRFLSTIGNYPFHIGKERFKRHWLGFLCWWWRWFLEDGTSPKFHRIFQVTFIKAPVPAGESGMQGVQTFLQFLPVKQETLLRLFKFFERGGLTDMRQEILSNELQLFILRARISR
jgi:hypothetical protein